MSGDAIGAASHGLGHGWIPRDVTRAADGARRTFHVGHIGVANVGDSGLRQIRREPGGGARVVARTREQQHCFNCPFQLSSLPSEAGGGAGRRRARPEAVQAGILLQDPPSAAELYSFSAEEGDLIVLATDGLYDNLWDSELCELAALAASPLEAQQAYCEARAALRGPAPSTDPGKLAAAIAHAAFYRARDPAASTPFQEHAREHGLVHAGGKMDDITVVCAWVVRSRPPSGTGPAAEGAAGP
ncbi:unnamed protein product [Prorocentrum cordatum]|uniref:Protein phosphatase n=1 Tax=Prorocentrum cordatum TaxID=2364126 RepID=A0ABN9VUC2_9DINO|nr:unnamed protein product [Polarella glacialis]